MKCSVDDAVLLLSGWKDSQKSLKVVVSVGTALVTLSAKVGLVTEAMVALYGGDFNGAVLTLNDAQFSYGEKLEDPHMQQFGADSLLTILMPTGVIVGFFEPESK